MSIDQRYEKKESTNDYQRRSTDDYDPYQWRDVKNGMTNNEAKINVIRCALGVGCLAMPLAYYNAGYVNGVIGTILLGVVLTYAFHKLMHAMYALCKRHQVPLLTYRQSIELALLEGPPFLTWMRRIAGTLVELFQALYHFGICSVYVLYICNTFKQMVDYYLLEIELRPFLILMIAPLLLIFTIRDLKDLVPFSFSANLMFFIGLVIIFFPLCFDLPSLSERVAFQKLDQLPLFYGTIAYALESVGVYIAIEAKMQSPQDFLGLFGILNQGLFIAIGYYLILGFFGYWHYGAMVRGSITLNIPDIFINQIVRIIFALSIFFSFALQGYVTVQVVWNNILAQNVVEHWRLPLEYLFRIIMVLSIVLVCVIFPDFDLVLPLVGASCVSFLGLIFPALMDLCLRYRDGYGVKNIHLFIDIILIILGIIGGGTGTTTSIVGIYYAL